MRVRLVGAEGATDSGDNVGVNVDVDVGVGVGTGVGVGVTDHDQAGEGWETDC